MLRLSRIIDAQSAVANAPKEASPDEIALAGSLNFAAHWH
jgi:hypothetical protein